MWAYSDESERADLMLIGIVVVSAADVGAVRTQLRALCLAGQRRIHTTNESSRRRRALLDTVGNATGLTAVGLTYRRPEGMDRVAGRHVLLAEATRLVVARGGTAWTLDDQDPAQRARDRVTIARTLQDLAPHSPPVYDHRPSYSEPLLWAADAICWAVSAGGEWRQRIERILTIKKIDP